MTVLRACAKTRSVYSGQACAVGGDRVSRTNTVCHDEEEGQGLAARFIDVSSCEDNLLRLYLEWTRKTKQNRGAIELFYVYTHNRES